MKYKFTFHACLTEKGATQFDSVQANSRKAAQFLLMARNPRTKISLMRMTHIEPNTIK